MTNERRIADALDVAWSYAQFDGGHHKMWVIDQMVRALLGEGYDDWVIKYCEGAAGAATYSWDEGIAP